MLESFTFYWYYIQYRFAEALARRNGLAPCDSQWLWACYRLGLYDTVTNGHCDVHHWRGRFARAVSLAACGHDVEAAALARGLATSNGFFYYRAKIAEDLAPFTPGLALEIIENSIGPAPLHAALLLRAGRQAEAVAILRSAIADGKDRYKPELLLLQSNAEPMSTQQKLMRMNAFLGSYSLAPLLLRDESLPAGPTNLRLATPLSPTHGPLVSVLMTAYQVGDRIESAIVSLLEQTYRDIEVIVVDDASEDETGDVVQSLAKSDPRVKYVRLPCNVGTYVAKSIGLRHATGEFVTCHDSDDWSHPSRIERQVRPLLNNKRLVFTTSQWVRIQDDGIYYARQVHPLVRLNPSSPLFRREIVLERAGAWDTVRTGADSEFLARLKLVFGRGASKRVVQPLSFGAHRPNSLMTATDTGYSPNGISPTRLAYWESWGHWHISELRAKRKPTLPNDLLADRRFAAPDSLVVPRRDIERCIASVSAK